MLLFDSTKVYDKAKGNIVECNRIMEMITTKRLPTNKRDPLYKYSNINFIGRCFLLHPDILLFNSYKYDQREIAIYYALAAMRSISEYSATQKITLDLIRVPVELDTINENRLLRIESGNIHFIYEEVNPMEIH
jgi:hypothetical protein